MGSSPHTRGAQLYSVFLGGVDGDHPRIRGEHQIALEAVELALGIIPAYAGSTPTGATVPTSACGSSPHTRGAPERPIGTSPTRRDHPRIRGEHQPLKAICDFVAGIIPAYAGNTVSLSGKQEPQRGSSPHTRGTPYLESMRLPTPMDHPRIRGEHLSLGGNQVMGMGIIPAYAGNTSIG